VTIGWLEQSYLPLPSFHSSSIPVARAWFPEALITRTSSGLSASLRSSSALHTRAEPLLQVTRNVVMASDDNPFNGVGGCKSLGRPSRRPAWHQHMLARPAD
jgi:hypothetical protein